MFHSGVRIVALLTALGMSAVMAREATAQSTFRGVVKTVDVGQGTVTVTVREEGSKQLREETFFLGEGARVRLVEVMTRKTPPIDGTLSDLIEGTEVEGLLAADNRTIMKLGAYGPEIYASVKKVAADGSTITVMVKERGRLVEKRLRLGDGIKVLLNDGLSKQDKDQEGALLDLTAGTPVLMRLSLDQKSVWYIRVLGVTLSGRLKRLDTANHQITLAVKEDGALVEKTFPLAANAQLADLSEGGPVVVRFSVLKNDTVVAAEGQKEGGG